MKATELRIGNYVECVDGIDQISEIRETGVKLLKFNAHEPENLIHYFDWIKPLPITQEWLLKFNAVCQPWGWVLNGIIIRWNITRKTCKYWIELGNGKRIELPFVHTLQNFFALTGEELTLP